MGLDWGKTKKLRVETDTLTLTLTLMLTQTLTLMLTLTLMIGGDLRRIIQKQGREEPAPVIRNLIS